MEFSLALAFDLAACVKRPVTIVGGGLAGLSCGIRLKSLGWDVTVYEKRRYPLKKVCGEFLSPRGWERVVELGAERYLKNPPVLLAQARFYYSAKSYFDFKLEPAALGISREALDSALASRFKDLGGILNEGITYAPNGEDSLVIDASGRAMNAGSQVKWIGWKGYLDATALKVSGIVMLPLDGGYCGLSPIEDGRISVCFVAHAPANVEALLRSHPILEPLAAKVRFHASIAGFDFIRDPQALKIGDAAAVWPPLVGDGMSRALGAGWDLAEALHEGIPLRSRANSGQSVQYALSKAMHSLMLSCAGRRFIGPALSLAPGLAGKAYQWSRG